MITLYRRHADGSTQYLTLTDRQGNLFGYPTLSVVTGRDFFVTKEKHITYADEAELQRALRRMIDRRLAAGYAVLYSYFRPDQYPRVQSTLQTAGRSQPHAGPHVAPHIASHAAPPSAPNPAPAARAHAR